MSGITIILFSENHLIAFDSAISVSTSNVTDFANDDNILSSAKLYTDAFWMQKKKSFKNALNNIGPTIEPCDTPEIMSLKSLQTLLTRTHCLRFFKLVHPGQISPYDYMWKSNFVPVGRGSFPSGWDEILSRFAWDPGIVINSS